LFSSSSECDAYRAQIAEIDAENQLALENYKDSMIPFEELAAEQNKLINDYYKNNPPDYSICPPYDDEMYSKLVKLARLDFEKRVEYWSNQSLSYQLYHEVPSYSAPYEIHGECMKIIDDNIRYKAPTFEPISYPISPTLNLILVVAVVVVLIVQRVKKFGFKFSGEVLQAIFLILKDAL
jgi:hypothetical protein